MVDDLSGLLTLQKASKFLGISKKDLLILVADGNLKSIQIGEKLFITANSIAALLNIETTQNIVTCDNGYQPQEELKSPLTNNQLFAEKGEQTMVYSGSISQLKDGRFMVQIGLPKSADGKRNRYNKSFRNEIDAKEHLREKLNELNGVVAPQAPLSVPTTALAPVNHSYTTLTFEEYAIRLLNGGVGNAGSRTIESYRRGLALVSKSIGKMPMVKITKQDLKKAFDKLTKEYAESSIKRAYTAVRLVLQTAFEDGDIPTDPTRKFERPKSRKIVVEDKHPIYTNEDLEVIFSKSKEYNFELYTMFTILSCTGMRPEELRALEWDCFNAEEKTIYIHQAISEEFGKIESLSKQPKSVPVLSITKSEYSVRTLQLSDLAVQALLEWKQLLQVRKNKNKKSSTFIFPNRKGTFKTADGLNSVVSRFKEKYNLGYMGLTPYKFRHTMCTNLCKAKYPIKVIQRIMGDNTADVITKIYTHVDNELALEMTKDFYKEMSETHSQLAKVSNY